MTDKQKTTKGGRKLSADDEALIKQVRDKYAEIARDTTTGCCGPSPAASCCAPAEKTADELGYKPEELGSLPDSANLGLGCGAPVQHLALREGETVLDLGSGAGIDVFLAAKLVGPKGKAIGVDMTPEMVARARDNAKTSGVENVDFREGRLEALPVDDASVDALTSNCVINLVPDKAAVFHEVARVLKPGGRMVISDIVLDGELPEAVRNDVLAYVGCVSGAMRREDYFAALESAGLSGVVVLSDVDVVTLGWNVAPGQVEAFAGQSGVSVDDLKGKVKSVTYRARK